MEKILFNTRDELVCVGVDLVAAVVADGNYSRVVYIDRKETVLAVGITQVEEALKGANSPRSLFIRLGRSLVINHSYLAKIDLVRQQITLTDFHGHEIRVNVPKNIIRSYKKAVILHNENIHKK